jgi:hypothetical protein
MHYDARMAPHYSPDFVAEKCASLSNEIVEPSDTEQ